MVERHPADSDGIRVVGDRDAQFECSVCGDWVHRFSVKYHGDKQYCPSCWNEKEPHIVVKDCKVCGDEYKQDPYQSNIVTYSHDGCEGERLSQTDLCDPCTLDVFGEIR